MEGRKRERKDGRRRGRKEGRWKKMESCNKREGERDGRRGRTNEKDE